MTRASSFWLTLLLLLGDSTMARAGQARRAACVPLQHESPMTSAQEGQVRAALCKALSEQGLSPLPQAEVERLLVATDLSCTTARCLAQAAGTLKVDILLGGRASREEGEKEMAWNLDLWLYDAQRKATVAALRDQCKGCDLDRLVTWSGGLVARLLEEGKAAGQGARIAVRSRPSGASVTIDGVLVGVTDMTFGVTPGQHIVTIQKPGHKISMHEVDVRPGAETEIDAVLQVSDDGGGGGDGGGTTTAGVLKWVLLGVAVAAVGAGVPLLAIDGECLEESGVPSLGCLEQRSTLDTGLALVISGGIAGGLAGLFFYMDARDRSSGTAAVAPAILRGGAGLNATWSF